MHMFNCPEAEDVVLKRKRKFLVKYASLDNLICCVSKFWKPRNGCRICSCVNKLNVRYFVEILALQIAAKQLQLATWLLLAAYRNLPTPYPTVPSPTLYDVPFSRNTKRYRQTTDRRTEHRTISATVLLSTVG